LQFMEAARLVRNEVTQTSVNVPGRSIGGFEWVLTRVGQLPRVAGSRVN
jgi:hypothetical protein